MSRFVRLYAPIVGRFQSEPPAQQLQRDELSEVRATLERVRAEYAEAAHAPPNDADEVAGLRKELTEAKKYDVSGKESARAAAEEKDKQVEAANQRAQAAEEVARATEEIETEAVRSLEYERKIIQEKSAKAEAEMQEAASAVDVARATEQREVAATKAKVTEQAAALRLQVTAAEERATAAEAEAVTAEAKVTEQAAALQLKVTAAEERATAAEERATAAEAEAATAEAKVTEQAAALQLQVTAAEAEAATAEAKVTEQAAALQLKVTAAEERATAAEERATAAEERATAAEAEAATAEAKVTEQAAALQLQVTAAEAKAATAEANVIEQAAALRLQVTATEEARKAAQNELAAARRAKETAEADAKKLEAKQRETETKAEQNASKLTEFDNVMKIVKLFAIPSDSNTGVGKFVSNKVVVEWAKELLKDLEVANYLDNESTVRKDMENMIKAFKDLQQEAESVTTKYKFVLDEHHHNVDKKVTAAEKRATDATEERDKLQSELTGKKNERTRAKNMLTFVKNVLSQFADNSESTSVLRWADEVTKNVRVMINNRRDTQTKTTSKIAIDLLNDLTSLNDKFEGLKNLANKVQVTRELESLLRLLRKNDLHVAISEFNEYYKGSQSTIIKKLTTTLSSIETEPKVDQNDSYPTSRYLKIMYDALTNNQVTEDLVSTRDMIDDGRYIPKLGSAIIETLTEREKLQPVVPAEERKSLYLDDIKTISKRIISQAQSIELNTYQGRGLYDQISDILRDINQLTGFLEDSNMTWSSLSLQFPNMRSTVLDKLGKLIKASWLSKSGYNITRVSTYKSLREKLSDVTGHTSKVNELEENLSKSFKKINAVLNTIVNLNNALHYPSHIRAVYIKSIMKMMQDPKYQVPETVRHNYKTYLSAKSELASATKAMTNEEADKLVETVYNVSTQKYPYRDVLHELLSKMLKESTDYSRKKMGNYLLRETESRVRIGQDYKQTLITYKGGPLHAKKFMKEEKDEPFPYLVANILKDLAQTHGHEKIFDKFKNVGAYRYFRYTTETIEMRRFIELILELMFAAMPSLKGKGTPGGSHKYLTAWNRG